jgi:hypothetical protein
MESCGCAEDECSVIDILSLAFAAGLVRSERDEPPTHRGESDE